MPDNTQLSESKRDLLQRYLYGRRATSSVGPSSIARRTTNSVAPLSLCQQQIWLNAQRRGVPPFYNESITLHRKGPLSPAVLEQSLIEILRRHEAWRTTFDVFDGQPVQIIHPTPARLPLTVVDLRALAENDREQEARRLAEAEVHRSFDLRRGPLFRPTLVRLGENDYRLHMAVHQIIIDGVTAYHVLLPELACLYQAFSESKPSPLPELPIQYADFAYWQREGLQGELLATQLAYWRKQLEAPLPVLHWPNDRPRPPKQTFRGTIQPFTLPSGLSSEIRQFAQSEGVTSFAALLTGFFALLHCYTRQVDIVVGTVSSARKRSEVQRLMGYFLNPVPLRVDLSGNPTVRELLSRVRRVSVGALSNDEVPFEHIVEKLRPEIDPSRNPFFQVAASLEPSMPDVDSSWNLTPMDITSGGARWDLYLVWDDRPDGIIGRVQYNPDLLEAATILKMLEHQETLLGKIVSNPEKRLSDLTI